LATRGQQALLGYRAYSQQSPTLWPNAPPLSNPDKDAAGR
jgi:hypothetical protein